MNYKKVFDNAKWIVLCRIAQGVINLIVNTVSARYLGPSNYGVLSYVASVISFVLPIMQLGLNKTLVYEYIDKPEKEGYVLGTSLLMNIIASFISIFSALCFLGITQKNHKVVLCIGALYSVSLLFQATEMIQYWFQAKLLSKYTSLASLFAYFLVAGYKIFLLVTKKELAWFAISNALDYFIISVILFLLYKKFSTQKLCFSLSLAKEMFKKSKHYILSGLMVMILTQTDKLMLNSMVGTCEVGYYSVAYSCINITSFFFIAIIDSMRPIILEEKKRTFDYEKRIIELYSIITFFTLIQSVFIFCFAKNIVLLLYGTEYISSIKVLKILCGYVAFSYYGNIRNIWILANEKQHYLWKINFIASIANVLLNYALIPKFMAIGAAFATVLSQFLANVMVTYFFKPIRRTNKLLKEGLNPKIWINLIKLYFTKLQ